ncbi:hypothetical protein BDW75DRAFT_201851 [Aspergillus navahoensis]
MGMVLIIIVMGPARLTGKGESEFSLLTLGNMKMRQLTEVQASCQLTGFHPHPTTCLVKQQIVAARVSGKA